MCTGVLFYTTHRCGTWLWVEETAEWEYSHFCSLFTCGSKALGRVVQSVWSGQSGADGLAGGFVHHCFPLSQARDKVPHAGCGNVHPFLLCLGKSRVATRAVVTSDIFLFCLRKSRMSLAMVKMGQLDFHKHFLHVITFFYTLLLVVFLLLLFVFRISLLFFQ